MLLDKLVLAASIVIASLLIPLIVVIGIPVLIWKLCTDSGERANLGGALQKPLGRSIQVMEPLILGFALGWIPAYVFALYATRSRHGGNIPKPEFGLCALAAVLPAIICAILAIFARLAWIGIFRPDLQ